jgi:hypothetical protein
MKHITFSNSTVARALELHQKYVGTMGDVLELNIVDAIASIEMHEEIRCEMLALKRGDIAMQTKHINCCQNLLINYGITDDNLANKYLTKAEHLLKLKIPPCPKYLQ